jgi:hypothetical protein
MCRQITCKKCKRPTWAGCGAHVEQVLGHVALDKRCACANETGERSGHLGLLGKLFSRLVAWHVVLGPAAPPRVDVPPPD